MITIVEPKNHYYRLWSNYPYNKNTIFRMMQYTLLCDFDDKLLLHNMVTGHTVELEPSEKTIVQSLPKKYDPLMEKLIESHFLVPEEYNEYQIVIGIYSVLRKLLSSKKDLSITHYTILPTTACNARCYYCFEQGVNHVTMTSKTINEVVDFIDDYCGENKSIRISWFGGEPTVASKQIDMICEGLQSKKIDFVSDITTNGYLFDKSMVEKAVEYWKLKRAMICVDGTEKTYNKTKAFVNVSDNPYLRVLRNVGLLIENHVHVSLRMNFDLKNVSEFKDFIEEIDLRFHNNPFLDVSCHPVVGEYIDYEGVVAHANSEWFAKNIVRLNDISRNANYLKSNNVLPCLNITGCQASDDTSITITPNGDLVKCPEQFGDDQIIGNVRDGIVNYKLIQSWKELSNNDNCKHCILLPDCMKLNNCATRDVCCYYLEMSKHHIINIRNAYTDYLVKTKRR